MVGLTLHSTFLAFLLFLAKKPAEHVRVFNLNNLFFTNKKINKNIIHIHPHGRVRKASQPGLRQTGKIRVTTPLATRPRPLYNNNKKNLRNNFILSLNNLLCCFFTLC